MPGTQLKSQHSALIYFMSQITFAVEYKGNLKNKPFHYF